MRVAVPATSEDAERDLAAAAAAEAAASGVEWTAADPHGPNGKIELPEAVLSTSHNTLLPRGEVGLLAGAGGAGKSRLVLQIAIAAAGGRKGRGAPVFGAVEGGKAARALYVRSSPVVMVGYEDAPPWVAWRARRIAEWLDKEATSGRHTSAVCDDTKLSTAVLDYESALFGGSGDADPVEQGAWRPVWDRVREIGAGLLVVDPGALAFAWDGPQAGGRGIGRFVSALRREAVDAGAAVLLVVHPSKAQRSVERTEFREGDDPGVAGSVAWIDRVRCCFNLVTDGEQRRRLDVTKANYAAVGSFPQLLPVLDDEGRPIAYKMAVDPDDQPRRRGKERRLA